PSKREKKQLAHLSGHLKKIQDALGALNDFAAHRDMVVDAALKASRQHRRALAFASGVVLGREDQAVRPLMKVAAKELRALHFSGRRQLRCRCQSVLTRPVALSVRDARRMLPPIKPRSIPSSARTYVRGALRDFAGCSIKKDDVTCPRCGAGFRRIELSS